VRAFDELGSVDAIAASGGNLYVVDIRQNQVWRYLPGEGGFDSERAALLDDSELRDVVEIAVGRDIYLLDAKRGVRRFVGKGEVDFKLAGIDTPLVAPSSISVLPGSGRIVVADRGNKRIILASPEGVFLRQLVSPSFTDIRAVSVDEGTHTMYVLNGDVLLKAAFPPQARGNAGSTRCRRWHLPRSCVAHLTVDLLREGRGARPRKLAADALGRGGAHGAATGRIGEQRLDRVRERLGVARGHEQAGSAIVDELGESAGGGGDHGSAARHRLGSGEAEPLVERRRDQHLRAVVQPDKLVD